MEEEIEEVTLISQGAEAKVFKIREYLGEPAIVKERLSKSYRHPDLDDRLNKERMKFVRFNTRVSLIS